MNSIYQSYASATDQIPVKMLYDTALMASLTRDKFVPVRHMQLCVTNQCNLNCAYCICRNRNRTEELTLEQIAGIASDARACGCRAITLTGGGEPLLYPQIDEAVKIITRAGIGIGLITNGTRLNRMPDGISWCRISLDSGRTLEDIKASIIEQCKKMPGVRWSFSFLLTKGIGEVRNVVEFANAQGFSHVRIVDDVMDTSDALVDKAREELKGIDARVIYQTRSHFVRGVKKCRVSILKPLIAANGMIYPCCVIQCAIEGNKGDWPKGTEMGTCKDLRKIVQDQTFFDGSVCDVCYYNHYNEFLALLLDNDVQDGEWM